VRSPFNFSGYYNDPDATDRRSSTAGTGPATSATGVGDEFYVAGRLKDVLIVGGVNVFPQDIEDLAGRVDGIQPGGSWRFARVRSAPADRAHHHPR
jgi:fatty-acyl-CoA synthase